MRHVFLIVILLLIVLPVPFLAQEKVEIWYFAQNAETDELIAFNLEGDSKVLMGEFDRPNPSSLYRIDEQTVLMQDGDKKDGTLHFLTPDSIEQIATGVQGVPLRPIGYHFPNVLMMPIKLGLEMQILILNLETGESSVLQNLVEFGPLCCRFSEDGLSIIYAGKVPESIDGRNAEWQLREHLLVTGEEKLIHSYITDEEHVVRFAADSYGERWLQFENIIADDSRSIIWSLIQRDGASEELSTASLDDPQNYHEYRLLNDDLLKLYPLCETDCVLELQSFGEDVSIMLEAGSDDSVIYETLVSPLYRSEDVLYFTSRDAYLQLREDSEPFTVGYESFFKIPAPHHSPDRRWMVLLDDPDEPENYGIWDNLEGRYVYIHPYPENTPLISAIFVNDFIVFPNFSRDDGLFTIFDPVTGGITQLPEITADVRGRYSQIISSDQILFEQMGEIDSRQSGIYLYNIEQNSFTLLQEGSHRILWTPEIEDQALYGSN